MKRGFLSRLSLSVATFSYVLTMLAGPGLHALLGDCCAVHESGPRAVRDAASCEVGETGEHAADRVDACGAHGEAPDHGGRHCCEHHGHGSHTEQHPQDASPRVVDDTGTCQHDEDGCVVCRFHAQGQIVTVAPAETAWQPIVAAAPRVVEFSPPEAYLGPFSARAPPRG